MRILRWICGRTRKRLNQRLGQHHLRWICDHIQNKVGVAPFAKKLVQRHLLWFGHV
jgi:hypothetical protein